MPDNDSIPAPTATRVAPRVETRPADEGPAAPRIAQGAPPTAARPPKGVRKMYRCIIKTGPSDGRGTTQPLAPFWFKSFGGKSFGVQSFVRVRDASGEMREVPQRGCLEMFVLTGDAHDELEVVKNAIARTRVRWTNRAAGRGVLLQTHLLARDVDPKTGRMLRTWALYDNPAYTPMEGDEPLADLVQIEEFVPGSDHGPIVDLTPKNAIPAPESQS